MTDSAHHDSGIITSSEVLVHYAEIALMYEELRAAIDDGHESMTHADALAEIAAIRAENAALQQGYDAARLEIDHLRGVTKMVAPSGEYPPLPEPAGKIQFPAHPYDSAWVSSMDAYDEWQMCDFADRTHALRASHGQEPAPTPQADSQPAAVPYPVSREDQP